MTRGSSDASHPSCMQMLCILRRIFRQRIPSSVDGPQFGRMILYSVVVSWFEPRSLTLTVQSELKWVQSLSKLLLTMTLSLGKAAKILSSLPRQAALSTEGAVLDGNVLVVSSGDGVAVAGGDGTVLVLVEAV